MLQATKIEEKKLIFRYYDFRNVCGQGKSDGRYILSYFFFRFKSYLDFRTFSVNVKYL
jgi:hypothetical protein